MLFMLSLCLNLLYLCVTGFVNIFTSLCLEECDGGCQRCVFCLLWSSAFPPPQITKSVDKERHGTSVNITSSIFQHPQ